jgi:hypothetical protein
LTASLASVVPDGAYCCSQMSLLPPGGPDEPSPEYGWVREMLGNATIRLVNRSIPVVDVNFTDITCEGV